MDKVNTTIETVLSSIDEKNNFVLEAGAGSGKTYTLIQTLLHLRNSELKQGQKILCVTFTNVAKDEIIERLESTGKSDKYTISTMHDFLWGFLVKFQGELQKEVKRLAEENKQKLKDELLYLSTEIWSTHQLKTGPLILVPFLYFSSIL